MAWTSGIHGMPSVAAIAVSHHAMVSPPTQVDGLMVFGCLSAVATAACYLRRHESRAAMLTFAAALAATGIYGFAEGAWPLGMLEVAWAFQAARRGLKSKNPWSARHRLFAPDLESRQSRYREVFGSN